MIKVLKPRFRKKVLIPALGILALGLLAGAFFIKTHRTSTTDSTNQQSNPTQSQEPSKAAADQAPQPTKTAPSPTNAPAKTTPQPAPTPISNPSHLQTNTMAKPTGQARNTDTIKLGDGVESTCQTVFNAKCGVQITLPNGKMITVKLTAVDDNGQAIINWNSKSDVEGATPGVWTIQLYTTKDGNSALGDPYKLTVN